MLRGGAGEQLKSEQLPRETLLQPQPLEWADPQAGRVTAFTS